MSGALDQVLAEALAWMDRGEPLAACLQRYPEHRDELEPLLRAADYVAGALAFVEPPSEAALAAGEQRMLRAAARRWPRSEEARRGVPWWRRGALPRLGRNWGLAMAGLALVLFLVLGGGAVAAAGNSLPGDLLYPVKRVTEYAHRAVTLDDSARAVLEARHAEERRHEAQQVAALGRRTEVHFQGTLQAVEPETWQVGGLTVLIEADTIVEGEPVLGADVWVHALSPGDGTLRARRLVVHRPPPPVAHPTETWPSEPTHEPSATPTLTPWPTPPAVPAHRTVSGPGPQVPGPITTPHPTEEGGPGSTHTPPVGPGPTETRRPTLATPSLGMMTPYPPEEGDLRPPHTPPVGPGSTGTPGTMMTPHPTEGGPGPTHTPPVGPGPMETHGPMMTPHPTMGHGMGPSPTPTPPPYNGGGARGGGMSPTPEASPTGEPPHGPMMTPTAHHTPHH